MLEHCCVVGEIIIEFVKAIAGHSFVNTCWVTEPRQLACCVLCAIFSSIYLKGPIIRRHAYQRVCHTQDWP